MDFYGHLLHVGLAERGPSSPHFLTTKLEDHGESCHSTIAAVPVEANLSGRSGCCCHRPDQRSKVSTYSTGPTWCPRCEKLNMKLQNMQRKRHPPDMRLRRYFRITVHFCLLEDLIQRHSIWFLVPSSWTWALLQAHRFDRLQRRRWQNYVVRASRVKPGLRSSCEVAGRRRPQNQRLHLDAFLQWWTSKVTIIYTRISHALMRSYLWWVFSPPD